MRLPAYQDLSKEQEAINNMPLAGSYLVAGPPGTGKTVIALYRSQMVEKKGRAAQLIMYNGLLMRYTAAALGTLEVGADSTTYLKWLHHTLRNKFGTAVVYPKPYKPDWTQVIGVLKGAGPNSQVVADLIIDEGQDLPAKFYEAAPLLANNVTVFADENQTINAEDNSTLEEIREGLGGNHRVLRLQRNYRNTAEIAKLADVFYTGTKTGIAEKPTRAGAKPEVRKMNSVEQVIELVRTYEANNVQQEIGVFLPTRTLVRKFASQLKGTTKNEVHAYLGNRDSDNMDLGSAGIRVMCSESAKGLEFDAVFIPEIQDYVNMFEDETGLRRRFYVLTSRARDRLFLLWTGATEPKILAMLPDSLVERGKAQQ